MKTQTTLDRTLGATPLLTANIALPEGLRKEAFLDSTGNCAAVQLAALLKTPLERIEREIDRIFAKVDKEPYTIDGVEHTWRELGVSSLMICEIGVNRSMNVYALHQGRKIAQHKTQKRGKRARLCFTVDGDHAWFFTTIVPCASP